MSADTYFERLNEILEKKKVLLQDMFSLTEAQTPAITSDSLDVLQRLIEEKQQKIDAIDKLDEEFGVYFERLKTTLKVKKLEDIDASVFPAAGRLKEVTAEILGLVGRISGIEKHNSENSKKLLDTIGSKIKQLNQGKKINNAYRATPQSTASYFLDKKK
jgi:hypothetical protein